MKEEWRQYQDTIYEVSNTGYVRNIVTNRILSPARTRQGYVRFTLWDKGKSRSVAVHRLIAETFLDNKENKPIVNHIDGNPSNNRLENLEWTTISENVRHAYETKLAKVGEDCTVAKLTEEAVLEIIECLKNKQSIIDTAKQFGVSAAAVSNIWHGRTWKHLKRDLPETKNYQGKLTVSDIPVIRGLFKKGLTDSEIASRYGLHKASIYNIRVGKNWKNY
jgi:hypothetical protein